MNMVFVNVSVQHILIFSSEDFICKLLANLVGKLRCDLSNFKGLDHMTGYDPVSYTHLDVYKRQVPDRPLR